MRKNPMLVSIITPAHNEEKLISSFVNEAARLLRNRKISGEVIVAENGSTDETNEILTGLAKKYRVLKVIHLPTGNKGRALKEAIYKAQGQYLITLDTDLWDESFVTKSLSLLQEGNAVVVGSKNAPGSKDKRSLGHKIITGFYNFLFRSVFNLKGTDTKARLAFNKELIAPLVRKCQTEDLVFDTELILRAERANLLKTEIPVILEKTDHNRSQRYSYRQHLGQNIRDFWTLIRVLKPSPNWSYIFLFGVMILAAFLRFYHYQNWFFYEVDEEHYSFMTRMITVNHHLPLIGGPISGTRLYMAPWFLYFSAFWFLLTQNSPLLYGIVTTFLGLFTLFIIYLIGKRLHSAGAGTLGALLYAVSFMMVIYDRHQWNVTLLPLISVLTMYLLMRWRDSGTLWLILAALAVSFGISSTFTAFAVFLFALTVVIFGQKPYLKKDLAIFLGVVVLAHIPLILFDLRHNFWLVRALGDFFFHPAYAQIPFLTRVMNTLSLLVESLGKALAITHPIDIADESSICTVGAVHFTAGWLSEAVAISVLIVSFLLSMKRRLSKDGPLLFWLLAINVAALIFFRADPSERHWLPFYPFFFLLLAIVLTKLWSNGGLAKITSIMIATTLIAVNIYSVLNSWSSYGWTSQKAAVDYIIAQTQSRQFYLDATSDSCHGWGYRYEFTESGHEPAGSYLDNTFSWMYAVPPDPKAASVRATILSPNKNYPESNFTVSERQKLIKNSYQWQKFGNVEVYLEKINASAN